MSILDEALAYLEQERGSWRSICARTGLDYSWLTKFAQRQIENPGVERVERLLKDKRREAA